MVFSNVHQHLKIYVISTLTILTGVLLLREIGV